MHTGMHTHRYVLVPGTDATYSRRKSMKPQVEVKSMYHRAAADCAPCHGADAAAIDRLAYSST